jgi:hypothetical protein
VSRIKHELRRLKREEKSGICTVMAMIESKDASEVDLA